MRHLRETYFSFLGNGNENSGPEKKSFINFRLGNFHLPIYF